MNGAEEEKGVENLCILGTSVLPSVPELLMRRTVPADWALSEYGPPDS